MATKEEFIFSPSHRIIATLSLLAITVNYCLNLTISNASAPYYSGGLYISDYQGSYVITAYLAGASISVPFTGSFARRFGDIKPLIFANILFNIASVLCGLAKGLDSLVVMRFIQGLVSGPLLPLCQTLIIKIYPHKQRIFANNLYSVVVTTSPMLGPFIGGWICYRFPWQVAFLIFAPIGLMVSLSVWVIFKGLTYDKQPFKFDYISFIFLFIGVLSLQILLDKGRQYNWLDSGKIWVLGGICIFAFLYLCVWSFFTPDTAISFKLFKYRTFSVSVFLTFVSYTMYYGVISLLPAWLFYNMGYTPVLAGAAILPLTIGPFTLGWFTSAIARKIGYTVTISSSFIFFAAACFIFAYFNTEVNRLHIILAATLFSFGTAIYTGPLIGLAVYQATDDELPTAAATSSFFRSFCCGIGTAAYIGGWFHRMHFHHQNLVSNFTEYRPASRNFFELIEKRGFHNEKALTLANDIINKQTGILAFNDMLWVMAWISVSLIVITILTRKKRSYYERLKELQKIAPPLDSSPIHREN